MANKQLSGAEFFTSKFYQESANIWINEICLVCVSMCMCVYTCEVESYSALKKNETIFVGNGCDWQLSY